MNSRILSYRIASSIGYSFILTIITAIVSIILKAFYPPFPFNIAPLDLLVISPIEGVIELIVIGLLALFTYPVRSTIERAPLMQARTTAIYTSIGYLAFSLLPYAIRVPYIQTYIGLVIAFNVLNGITAGVATSISLKE
ncbi:MAG: hypothetical protein OWQ54_02500 [Sulfolobaceae archaeon]|nr:hypothetical protein [Sulfolobaceae archaeon]